MTTYRVSPNVKIFPSPGATIVLITDGGKKYSLNRTASTVWLDLSKGKSVEEIANQFKEEYEIPKERGCIDVQALVDELYALSLVVSNEGTL